MFYLNCVAVQLATELRGGQGFLYSGLRSACEGVIHILHLPGVSPQGTFTLTLLPKALEKNRVHPFSKSGASYFQNGCILFANRVHPFLQTLTPRQAQPERAIFS
jgi:hypothetical protein